MEKASDEDQSIFVPTICIVEATYLTEKNRIEGQALARLGQVINQPDSDFEAVPLTVEIALRLREIPRSSVPDLPDRVIAATALALGLPVVTHDAKIRASSIEMIW